MWCNAESSVATDQQALISSQSALNYQQQIIKQAIARNLNDPALSAAPVIPTDRVSLEAIPEEKPAGGGAGAGGIPAAAGAGAGGADAAQRRDHAEGRAQCAAADARCLRVLRRRARSGGSQSPDCNSNFFTGPADLRTERVPTSATARRFSNLFNNSAPDKGVGFNLTIPIRNREAQSVQARSLMEYRQAELRLEQLYTQIRMQVVNAQFALTNDRAQVQAAHGRAATTPSRAWMPKQKKLHLGASTTANVLQQERNLATAEDNLIAAQCRLRQGPRGPLPDAGLDLQHYGINLTEAATGP